MTQLQLRDDVKEVLDSAPEYEQETLMYYYMDPPTTKFQEKGISVNLENHYGGEGQGENYWTVRSFERGNEKVYVKFYGYYMSYEGATYQDYCFVEPREVLEIHYFEI